ncbi:hypothetical protein MANES_09G085966v8 [Manihot esculenta]|uniref:Uncharacterized protein n=1 Tax=Manihot esculenta TaxID=3983 RepID=A0ACB7H5S9_MANES|nr:hypothetical protein MANES_09G085966v8 [Manihot esculenta]
MLAAFLLGMKGVKQATVSDNHFLIVPLFLPQLIILNPSCSLLMKSDFSPLCLPALGAPTYGLLKRNRKRTDAS